MDAHLQQQICARIKTARVEAGFTQDEMADLLGMTMRGYQNYETDRVPWRKLDKIAELTGRTQEWFLRGDRDAATQSEPTLPEVLQRLDQIENVVESLRQVVVQALAALEDQQVAN